MSSAMRECARVSRSFHAGSYVASLYIGQRLGRAAALVLRALAGEVAAASRQSTPGLASLRLSFWRRAAEAALENRIETPTNGIALGDGSQAPAIIALRALSGELRLGESAVARRRLLTLVDNAPRCCGRGELVEESGGDNTAVGGPREAGHMYVQRMNELEAMAEAVDSNILYLTNTALRETADVHEFEHAASHVGKAVGIVRMIQNTPLLASERRSILPTELCAKFGLVMEDVYRGNSSEALRDTIHAVASVAHGHLAQARDMSHTRGELISQASKRVLLPGLASQQYLDMLEKREFDIFHPDVQNIDTGLSQLQLQMQIAYNAFVGRY